jgi:Protein of unknown function (DUF3500)
LPDPRCAHTEARRQNPRAQELLGSWAELAKAPFSGITTDGHVTPSLFSLQPSDAPTSDIIAAVTALLGTVSPAQRTAMTFPVESDQWRRWQNTELYVEDYGLRLDEGSDSVREAVMEVLRASLSPKGYETPRAVMQLNRFLDDLVGCPSVLGEWSYTFCLFGAPSATEPWGWQLFDHLTLTCFVLGRQMVLTPAFLGAEPADADTGPLAGSSLFEDEERAGLALMRLLSPAQQRRASVAHSIIGGDLPTGRRYFADNLHLGGAHQDNRIIPYEGIQGSALSAVQRRQLLDLIAGYVATLPSGPRAARMEEIERHLGDTYFCWIGGHDETSPFCYRIQSPVLLVEFDHHAGVFLTNAEPAKFHVHTIVRTRNGNDYGIDLLRLHFAHARHHQRSSNFRAPRQTGSSASHQSA